MHPIDLLPIEDPLTDKNPPDDLYFYENVIMPILPYVMEMEANGIPIDLTEVRKLEDLTEEVLSKVHQIIDTNPIIIDFLTEQSEDFRNNAHAKTKIKEDYVVTFNRNNVIHRTFVVNEYLKSIHADKDCMDKWSIKDIAKYASITGSKFLEDIARNNILNPDTAAKIHFYMEVFAIQKANLYNEKVKSRVEGKAKDIKFNPGSTKQKAMLFEFLGIKSEEETPKGQDKWDRDQLEILKKKLEMEIENETV